MKGIYKHPVRVALRSMWLAAELGLGAVNYLPMVGFGRGDERRGLKARWLQRLCRRLVRVFRLEVDAGGAVPLRGVLVSNHLSYLDIIVLSATTPVVFVSKSEVANWPVFGWFARMSGTLFVRRENRTDVARMGDEIKTALAAGALVVLFPEGTSSGGEMVLPFKSSLLEPVACADLAITAACVQYELEEGAPAAEVCYWRDMTLVPHLLNLLSKERIQARVRFTELQAGIVGRKELARQLHAEVVRLKLGLTACTG